MAGAIGIPRRRAVAKIPADAAITRGGIDELREYGRTGAVGDIGRGDLEMAVEILYDDRGLRSAGTTACRRSRQYHGVSTRLRIQVRGIGVAGYHPIAKVPGIVDGAGDPIGIRTIVQIEGIAQQNR